jgi:hypothetical protein
VNERNKTPTISGVFSGYPARISGYRMSTDDATIPVALRLPEKGWFFEGRV